MTRHLHPIPHAYESHGRPHLNSEPEAPLAAPFPADRAQARPGSGNVLTRLRAETRELHTRLEQRFDAVAALREPGGQGEVCARFYALHKPLDAVLAEWLMDVPGLQFERRRRLAGLAASLMRLGAAMPVNAPPPPRLPGSRSEALGLLYVLEGSTLGGRVILRQLASTGMDLDGLGFLDPYGSESGRMWRQFLELLEIHVSGSETGIEQAVIGARNGFEWAEACLCKRPTKTRNAA